MAGRRLVLAGLAAAGVYGAWRARRSSTGPGPGQGSTAAPVGAGGAADFRAGTTSLDGTTGGAARDALAVPSAYGADPAAGAGSEGAAGLPAPGTRADDPLTGVTERPSELPEATASPDGTPAAGPVETRRVGDDPA